MYQVGQLIFTVATLLCFFAKSLPFLLIVRAAQAVGAAGALSVSSALIRSTYPSTQLGRGLGINSVIVSSSAAAAPTIGGLVLAVAPWPWVFACAIPFALLSLMLGRSLPDPKPGHHVAYLYAFAGAPWRTQARLKQIVDSQYNDTPAGLSGNDDIGQMSAWLVFTALGFYPVAPGSGQYVIGRPFADRATINLPNGKRFTIVADGMGEANRYVGSVTLNGKPLERVYITHDEIERGGELRFAMSATPNKVWGTSIAARPYSMSGY